MKFSGKILLPVIMIFVAFTVFIFAAGKLWEHYNIDRNVLLGANVLFMLLSMLTFLMQKKSLGNSNPNVFVRTVIAGMMIKMFSVVIAVLIYVLSVNAYDKKAVFISLIMYLFYLGAEVMSISKEIRKKNG